MSCTEDAILDQLTEYRINRVVKEFGSLKHLSLEEAVLQIVPKFSPCHMEKLHGALERLHSPQDLRATEKVLHKLSREHKLRFVLGGTVVQIF